MNIKHLFEQLINKQDLSSGQIEEIMTHCMRGELTDVQIATFLALMRMKGETVEELTGCAKMMLKFAENVNLGRDLVDIVGTGGDGKNTFNVSTVSSFVAAAAGVKVAKHGNYSVSSRSGSADFLEQAGFKLSLSESQLNHCINDCGIAFLFAPHFHKALQSVRAARQQLGIRTLFNLIGPLLNPAQVKRQVIGVYANQWLKPLAMVLANLGSTRILVVNSRDGMDEISIAALTDVVEYRNGKLKEWVINPQEYDCAHNSLDPIVVETPEQSLKLAESVFNGSKGPARDIILLNAAAAIYCAELTDSYSDAIQKASQAIDSGLAGERFTQLKTLTIQVHS